MNAVTEVMDELRKALAELEDCRARNADLRTMLERVSTERDEAQARVIDAALIHAELVRERDEALANVERWKRACNVLRERDWPHAFQVTVTRLEREVSDAHDQLAKLRRLSKPWEGDAYRRGAEAMREACQQWCRAWENDGDAIADALADLQVEDK